MFGDLAGFAADDHLASWGVIMRSARAVAEDLQPLRAALAPCGRLRDHGASLLAEAAPTSPSCARALIERRFEPFSIEPLCPAAPGFVTGYYEPVVAGSLTRTAEFSAPIIPRPPGIDHAGPGIAERPTPSRRMIETDAEAGRHAVTVWLRDWAEVFLMQVQGSGQVVLPDGSRLRLVYDGRNGLPYTSIGRILIDAGEILGDDMSLERLKDWIRSHGQAPGEPGRSLMWCNRSYVFFRAAPGGTDEGPIGGQGLPLSRLRSIAVDRSLWSYGLPFWIEADLPWRDAGVEPFRRLMLAQDTGSAILGPARADLYFGSGEAAGQLAGGIRHPARFVVLLPRPDGDPP